MLVPWEQLPRKNISSAALFFDVGGNILIVKPTYKEGWGLVGGAVDSEEGILEACIREINEEIGLRKKPRALLCVDYVEAALQRSGHDGIHFVFDGGVLTEEEIRSVQLPKDELSEYRFVGKSDLPNYFQERMVRRIANGCISRAKNIPAFLKNGHPIF